MTFFIIPIAIAVLFALMYAHEILTDGLGHRPLPPSHHRDERFVPPSERSMR